METIPQNEAISEAARIWEYVKRVLSNEALLHELGFAERDAVEQVVIVFRAGNRLHPTKGFDFLGSDWMNLDEEKAFQLLDKRDEAVENILQNFLNVLETEGYEAACQYVQSASKYQVLYFSRSQNETRQRIQEMLDCGLGTNEISDNLLERHGNSLIFGHDENISYYIWPDTFDADEA